MLICSGVGTLKHEITFACEIKGINLASDIWSLVRSTWLAEMVHLDDKAIGNYLLC